MYKLTYTCSYRYIQFPILYLAIDIPCLINLKIINKNLMMLQAATVSNQNIISHLAMSYKSPVENYAY